MPGTQKRQTKSHLFLPGVSNHSEHGFAKKGPEHGLLTASSPVPLMGEPGGPALSRPVGAPGGTGWGGLGLHARGLGTFQSQAGPTCTRAMAMVPLGVGPP